MQFFIIFLFWSHSLFGLSIALSNAPYTEIIRALAGDEATVFTIVPENGSTHTFEPSPKQIEQLRSADLWFGIGELFETKIRGMLRDQGPQFIDLRKGVALLEETHECCQHHHDKQAHNWDPHIWMDPARMEVQVVTMAEALQPYVPQEVLKIRKEQLLTKLQRLKQQLNEALTQQKGLLIISHPGYAYLLEGLPIEQISLEQEGKELSPKALSNTVMLMKQHHVSTIFTQPQYSQKSAEKIASHTHAKIVSLNPYSATYFEELLKIGTAFHIELQQQQGS